MPMRLTLQHPLCLLSRLGLPEVRENLQWEENLQSLPQTKRFGRSVERMDQETGANEELAKRRSQNEDGSRFSIDSETDK